MTLFGLIGFTTPWLLVALAALPVLWIILRAVPPDPVRRLFPGVILLLGLRDDDQQTDRTPWWLLLLRMLAVAAVIVGLAGPVLNPEDKAPGSGSLLIAMDASWASARDWQGRIDMLTARLDEAQRANRPVAILRLTAPEAPVFQSADSWRARLPGLMPEPWEPSAEAMAEVAAMLPEGRFDTLWFSDGLARPGREPLRAALEQRGGLAVVEPARSTLGVLAPRIEDGVVHLRLIRSRDDGARTVAVQAHGRDPAGNPALLAVVPAEFAAGATEAEAELSLPAELRARLTRIEVEGIRSAGSVALADDSLRRREVALIAGREGREGLELLSPLHYLTKALQPTADLIDGALSDVLPANPDVIVLADVTTLTTPEAEGLLAWIDDGGLLLRFAGPRLAASDLSRETEDALMPVRLRAGGRTVGGAMSWGEPKALAPFPEGSPFFGLPVPADVTVTAQVMAQPDPTLADRVIAQLADGTPLVTRKRIGQGQVVLVHVTANAEWSTLPLSGLFVQMLERLAISSATAAPQAEDLVGTHWQPEEVLDGFGRLTEAGTLAGVAGDRLVSAPLGPDLRPGLYAGEDRRIARNVIGPDTVLSSVEWPAGTQVLGLSAARERPLGGLLLALATVLLLADVVASLALSGRLWGAVAALALAVMTPAGSDAQTLDAIEATSELHLAHVLTSDRALDDTANAGLFGLSDVLFFRTSIEPAAPVGVDLESDELAFYPLLYWPITPGQPQPSDAAYERLNAYLRSGGMILFDTRDADVARFGGSSPNGRKLQQLAAPLDIPPLEPLPSDHVLTRTFYLLQDFPGRYDAHDLWVEAAPADAEVAEGMPFRNLNDGVTPVVIGGNDWAAAWATDRNGNAMFPVGRGYAGERQRELAYRFGVNLVMHVLTGNYKSDQVHVPALLERLGQ